MPVMNEDITADRILYCVQCELAHARVKFPGNESNFTALVEEVGELAEALLKKDTKAVFAEGIQVIVMALRVIQEEDHTHNVKLTYADYEAFPTNKRIDE